MMRSFGAVAVLIGMAGAGCGTQLVMYEGPDRPGGEDVEGPAPPSDYQLGERHRVIDTNGDKRGDRIEYYSSGQLSTIAEDSNYDGRIDIYRRVVNGKIVDEVHDKDYDGVFDVRMRDTDGDGVFDVTEKMPTK
jgi:hypothetical protein